MSPARRAFAVRGLTLALAIGVVGAPLVARPVASEIADSNTAALEPVATNALPSISSHLAGSTTSPAPTESATTAAAPPTEPTATASSTAPTAGASPTAAGTPAATGKPAATEKPAAAASPAATRTPARPGRTATPAPTREPEPEPPPATAPADQLLGNDGRLTVLLLGSDFRPSHPGHRTDAIMVVSVDPTTGESGAFSVPRDTVNFPLPRKGNYGAKVNGLLMHLQRTTPNGYVAMKQAVSRAFSIEVDRYAFTGFAGVRHLVNAVGGVDVTLEKAYYDPYYWVTKNKRGWGLPAGTSHLDGKQALIFARSRKGDNDFGRARRQQQLVMAAFRKARDLGPGKLPELLAIASNTVRTDLPLSRANDLFELYSTVDLGRADRVVFGPRTFATGTAGGNFALKLNVCRHWIAQHFPPARPGGTWP